VNPTLTELADKTMVLNTAMKLVHIAVDMNLKVVQGMPKSPEKTAALEYHNKIAANRSDYLQSIAD